ncbi:hypothetical protein GOODEAATRI_010280, partial [Goodea atripinnis]
LRESFKDLKKRFSNTKFNYLKRNDRTRNLKGVWNQLQQMEVKRIHRVMAQQGSEVKNTCVARQVEDAVNELQRQMGQLERNICEHQKTLDMTCRLQQAMDELWCEEASATIARVGKFSLECRSTEAVSVLYRQFEKFVWPTVPQQEERISQITELAVRLHGGWKTQRVEEGQRYIEKTVSKHSEMVESIRELSNGLMELEAKLKCPHQPGQPPVPCPVRANWNWSSPTTERVRSDRKLSTFYSQSAQQHQDVKSVTNSRETTPQRDSLTKASTSLISQQSTHIQSSFSGNHCTIQKVCSNSYSDPVPKSEQSFQSSSVADSVLHKDLSLLQDDDFLEISTTIPQSSTTPQDPDPSRNSTNTRSKQDQDVPSPLRDSSLWATTTITQQSIFNQSFSSGRSQTDTTSNKDARDPPLNLTHSPPQPTSINNIGICCSKQSLQTVYPLQEFLIFNHTQQFVHGPSMSPSLAQPAPPKPDPQTHASPHPANLHGTSPYSPPHVLTPTQDPDICLPMAIREEIRLTPQIQGPHLLQSSSESLPLEKASQPGLPCFTRPLSQAIIMEGSPVTLEVENRDQEQTCSLQDSQRLAGSSSSVGDNWLVLEAFDIIMEDWSTWFGTLRRALAPAPRSCGCFAVNQQGEQFPFPTFKHRNTKLCTTLTPQARAATPSRSCPRAGACKHRRLHSGSPAAQLRTGQSEASPCVMSVPYKAPGGWWAALSRVSVPSLDASAGGTAVRRKNRTTRRRPVVLFFSEGFLRRSAALLDFLTRFWIKI